MLLKVISGGQTGVDIAGLKTAKRFGIATGGWMTQDWMTLAGPKPEYADIYGMKAWPLRGYKERTRANARESDGTIRIAKTFLSPGEVCTKQALLKYDKPYLDFMVNLQPNEELRHHGLRVASFIRANKVEVLNVAGNSEQTAPGIFVAACWILRFAFEDLGFELVPVREVG